MLASVHTDVSKHQQVYVQTWQERLPWTLGPEVGGEMHSGILGAYLSENCSTLTLFSRQHAVDMQ